MTYSTLARKANHQVTLKIYYISDNAVVISAYKGNKRTHLKLCKGELDFIKYIDSFFRTAPKKGYYYETLERNTFYKDDTKDIIYRMEEVKKKSKLKKIPTEKP